MNTDQQMDRLICDKALELYRAIEAALEGGRGGYAKEKLTELRSFLKCQTQHSAFRNAMPICPAQAPIFRSGSPSSPIRVSRSRTIWGNCSASPEIHFCSRATRPSQLLSLLRAQGRRRDNQKGQKCSIDLLRSIKIDCHTVVRRTEFIGSLDR